MKRCARRFAEWLGLVPAPPPVPGTVVGHRGRLYVISDQQVIDHLTGERPDPEVERMVRRLIGPAE